MQHAKTAKGMNTGAAKNSAGGYRELLPPYQASTSSFPPFPTALRVMSRHTSSGQRRNFLSPDGHRITSPYIHSLNAPGTHVMLSQEPLSHVPNLTPPPPFQPLPTNHSANRAPIPLFRTSPGRRAGPARWGSRSPPRWSTRSSGSA